MPELRGLRPEQVLRVFERLGGVRRMGKGSHINIKMPDGTLITFSGGRKEVKVGLLKAMLRKANVSEEEFLELLKG